MINEFGAVGGIIIGTVAKFIETVSAYQPYQLV
jgi:hypothetical protein